MNLNKHGSTGPRPQAIMRFCTIHTCSFNSCYIFQT
uniref:Uncharacterized protein n=1 Tax=Anguilla anguilla TaxID=7936 RepID=A0A0E9R9C6_ANGAN